MKKLITVFMSLMMFLSCMTATVSASTTYYKTDVTTAGTGNILVGAPGTFVGGQADALKLINSYRYEACKQGLINPQTKKKLTLSDYVPLKWSEDLETIARIRAAEASVTISHTRTNGSDDLIRLANGVKSSAELLAWNSQTNMVSGVKLWYAEKSAYVNKTGGVSGHYAAMINPAYKYIGISMFLSDVSGCPNTTSCEMQGKFATNPSEKYLPAGKGVQIIEIKKSLLKNTASISARDNGSQLEFFLNLDALINTRTCSGFVAINPTWQKVKGSGTLSSNGVYTPSVCGEVTVRATSGSYTAEKTITKHCQSVSKITRQPTCSTYGVRTYSCPTCNVVIKTESVAKIAHSFNIYNRCSRCSAYANGVSASVPSVKISSIFRLKAGFKVKWSKNSKLKGYEIRYSTSSSMKNAKTVKITSYKTRYKTIKKLKRKTTYYVQIRGYKKIGSSTKYSVWSAVKKVKTK